MEAAHKDARHAEWLLERQFPREFAPYDRRPIPQEEPTSGVKFIATLPSAATADVDGIWKVAREFHQASLPRKQQENEPKPKNDDEPMKNWYNPATRRALNQSTMAIHHKAKHR